MSGFQLIECTYYMFVINCMQHLHSVNLSFIYIIHYFKYFRSTESVLFLIIIVLKLIILIDMLTCFSGCTGGERTTRLPGHAWPKGEMLRYCIMNDMFLLISNIFVFLMFKSFIAFKEDILHVLSNSRTCEPILDKKRKLNIEFVKCYPLMSSSQPK